MDEQLPEWCNYSFNPDPVNLGEYACRHCYRIGRRPSAIIHDERCSVQDVPKHGHGTRQVWPDQKEAPNA